MFSRLLLLVITVSFSLQSTAASINVVFDVQTNQRLLPVAGGRFVEYSEDTGYQGEQFQIIFTINSNDFSVFDATGYDHHTAQYFNPVVTDNSMLDQHVNSFLPPAELNPVRYAPDNFTVSQSNNDTANESVNATVQTQEYLITEDGDYRYYQTYQKI